MIDEVKMRSKKVRGPQNGKTTRLLQATVTDFDDLNEFNLLLELDLLSSTRSDRFVVGSHLSEPTITQ
jgi:hypothetical protein